VRSSVLCFGPNVFHSWLAARESAEIWARGSCQEDVHYNSLPSRATNPARKMVPLFQPGPFTSGLAAASRSRPAAPSGTVPAISPCYSSKCFPILPRALFCRRHLRLSYRPLWPAIPVVAMSGIYRKHGSAIDLSDQDWLAYGWKISAVESTFIAGLDGIVSEFGGARKLRLSGKAGRPGGHGVASGALI